MLAACAGEWVMRGTDRQRRKLVNTVELKKLQGSGSGAAIGPVPSIAIRRRSLRVIDLTVPTPDKD
jgi:uncharacterized spore protein YtfJ